MRATSLRTLGLIVMFAVVAGPGCGPGIDQASIAAEKERMRKSRMNQERDLGIQAFQDGDLELAGAFLRNSHKLDSDDHEVTYYLALTERAEGRTESAYKYAITILNGLDDTPFVSAFRLYAELAVELQRLDEAEDLLKEYSEEDPTNLTRLNFLHRIYLEQGKHADVTREARGVLKKDETNVDAMHNLALAYLRTKRPEQAKYIIQRAVDLEENNPGSYVLLGQVYEQLELPPKALEAWEKAHALSPRSPSILNALAVQYLRVGDHQSASDLLQGAVRYSPSYVEARINLGNALRGLKEYAGAKSAYEQSLKLNPLAADAHYNLGILFLQNDVDGQGELERFKRALGEFEQFRERAGLGAAEDLAALIQETQGLIKLAVERREQALKAEEESEDAEDEESDEEDEPLE